MRNLDVRRRSLAPFYAIDEIPVVVAIGHRAVDSNVITKSSKVCLKTRPGRILSLLPIRARACLLRRQPGASPDFQW
jgi:hypothetical protein